MSFAALFQITRAGLRSMCLAAVVALVSGLASAQSTLYWTGSSTWGDAAAWSTDAAGTIPGSVPTSADTAFFSANTVTLGPTVGLVSDRSLAGLAFGGTATGTTTLAGGGANALLTLGSGGIAVGSTVGSAVTIGSGAANQGVAIAVGADQTWTNDSTARLLSIVGGVSRAAGDTTNRTLTVSGNGSSTVSGAITDGGASGSLGLTKTGTGTLTLGNASNTFTGPLTLSGGLVAVGSNAALGGGSGPIVFNNGGGLRTTSSFSLSRNLQLVTGSSTLNVDNGTTLTFSGSLANAAANTQVRKTGQGTLELSQPGPAAWSGSIDNATTPTTLTGGLLVSRGTVRITNGAALGAASNIAAIDQPKGAVIALSGGITLPNQVVLNINSTAPGADGAFGGYGVGMLTSESGVNTLSGTLNVGRTNASIGASAGATLNVTGGVAVNARILTIIGPGAINISGGGITNANAIQTYGSGTTTITTSIGQNNAGNSFRVNNRSTLALAGGAALTGTHGRNTIVSGGGTLRIDNSTTAVSNRLAASPLLFTIRDGTYNLIGNASSPVVETSGTLQLGTGGQNIVIDTTAQATSLQFTNLPSPSSASILTLRAAGTGANFGTTSNQVVFRNSLPTLTPSGLGVGILPRGITVDGQGWNFATYSNGSIRAFGAYDTGSLNAASLPTTSSNATVQVGSSVTLAGNRTVNAVKFGGGGLTVGGAGSVLTLGSGGLLATGGTSTIGSGVAITSGATSFGLTVADDSKITINAPVYTTNAMFVRGGGGLVEVAAPVYVTGGNYYVVTGGTTRLLAGGMFFPGQGTPTGNENSLALSARAVLDLNGNSQLFGQVATPDNTDFENAGGEVTSATPAVFATRNMGNAFVMPSMTGALTAVFAGRERTWFTSANTYTGRTAFLDGTFTLKDGAQFTATSAVDMNYGGLVRFWNDDAQYALPDRINDLAPVTMRAARLEYVGQRNSDTGETLGATTLAEGVSDFNVYKAVAADAGSAVVTLASLAATNGGAYFRSQTATLGLPGDNPRIIVTANETDPGAGLTNNLLGGWASVDGTDFASYLPGQGVGALNQTGYAGYNGTTLPASSAPTENIKLSADGTVPTGTYVLNSLAFSNNIAFTNATDTLALASGGLMRTSGAGAVTIGATADSGRLTAGAVGATGTQALYIHNNAASGTTTTVNARIVDNGSAPVAVVATLNNTGTLTLASANNSYTGGTVVNVRDNAVGTMVIAAGGLLPAGGLTINGANVTAAAAGGIAASNVVAINGPGALTLTGANTLEQLVFNNTGSRNGSNINPTVTTGGALTLSSGTAIIAGGMNPAGVAIVTGTLDFGGNAKTFTVTPIQYDGMTFAPFSPVLNITGTIVNAGKITVNGGGLLQVTGSSTFAGGYSVAGDTGLIISSSSAGSVTSGPLGTGTLELASGARLLSGGAFNVANAVSMSGTLTFAGVNSGTLSGAVALPTTATFDVTAPQPTLGLTGVLSGVGSAIVKNGYGTLAVTGVNTFDGGVTVNQGELRIGNASALGTGTLTMNGGRLDVSTGSLTVANAQVWNGGFGFVGTNGLTMSGAVTLAANSTLGVTGTLTVSGNIGDNAGNYGLTKSGAGFLNLTGANTYGGTTVVNAGVLSINGTSALPGWDTAGRYSVSDGGAIAVPNSVADADVTTMINTGNFGSGGAIGFDTTGLDRTWGSAITGGMGVAKIGTNALVLSASNSYTGPTLVYSGSLSLADQNAAQNSILSTQTGVNVGFDSSVSANAFTLGGLAGSGTVRLVNSAAAAITLTVGGANATTAFSGALSAGGALTKVGSGTQTLSGANINYTGATTVSNGTLLLDAASGYASATAIDSAATLVVANSANQTLSVALTGAGTIVKQAAGILTLSSASNNHSGNLVIEQGQITYSGGTLASSGTVTVLGSGTLNIGASDRWGGASTTTSAKIVIGPGGRMNSAGFLTTLVDPQLDGGTLALTGGLAGSGAYGLKGTVTVSQASQLGNVSGANNWVNIGPTDTDGFLTFDVARMTSGSTNGVNPDLLIATEFRNPAGRVNGLRKTGAGLLRFNGTGSYTGGTVIDNGVFQLQGTLSTTGTITVNNGGILRMGAHDRWGNATTTSTAPIVINAGGLVQSNNYFNTFIDLGLGGGTLQATGGFDGTWQAFGLKGTIAVTGTTPSTIEVGTNTGNGLNAINIGPTPNQGAAGFLTFNVADVTSSAAADLVVSTILRNGFSDVFVFNANGIAKTGAGTMQLTGKNEFTGGLNISAGVLEIGGAGQLASGNYAGPIVADGTFRWASSAAQTLSGTISGAGTFQKAGSGVLTFTGTSAFAGTTNVQTGQLVLSGSLASSLIVDAAAFLSGTGSAGATTISGTLSPGNSPGVLTFSSLTLTSTASTLIELTGTGTRGIDYDGVNILDASGLAYGGSMLFSFGGLALEDGTTFNVFDFSGSSAGAFSSVTSTGFYAGTWINEGGAFSLTQGLQKLTFTNSTGDLVVSAVPEPGSFVIAGIGLATLAALARRRRTKA